MSAEHRAGTLSHANPDASEAQRSQRRFYITTCERERCARTPSTAAPHAPWRSSPSTQALPMGQAKWPRSTQTEMFHDLHRRGRVAGGTGAHGHADRGNRAADGEDLDAVVAHVTAVAPLVEACDRDEAHLCGVHLQHNSAQQGRPGPPESEQQISEVQSPGTWRVLKLIQGPLRLVAGTHPTNISGGADIP